MANFPVIVVVVVLVFQVWCLQLSQQAARSAEFTMLAGVRYSDENITWPNVEMTDVQCATLATLREVEGFNLLMDDGKEAFGRCQVVPVIDVDSLVAADNYAFYSRIPIPNPPKKVIDPCADNPCNGAAQRFIAARGDVTKYLDCAIAGIQCLLLTCPYGTIFKEAVSTCVMGMP